MVRIIKYKKVWLTLALGLGGFILLVALAINPLLKKLLASRVENELIGNFYYHYDDLSVDLFSRSVALENVTWRFPKDTTVFNHQGGITRLKISGVSLLSLIGSHHYSVREISFDGLHTVTGIEPPEKENPVAQIESNNVSLDFYELIKGQMKSLEVGKIVISNGQAIWLNPKNRKVWRQIDSVQFEIRHIQLDSTIAATNNGWFTLQNAMLEGKNGALFLADSLHKIHLKKIQIDYHQKHIIIDSLQVIPLFSKSQMRTAKRYQTDRLEITVPDIKVTGIDFESLMVSNKLRIEHILVDHLTMDIFRDKNQPIPDHHYVEMPHVALKNSPLNIKIDSVHLTNSHIHYGQLSELTQKTGAIFFSDLNAELYNITNDSLSYQQNAQAKLNMSANLMGKGRLDADFTFNLLAQNGDHWFKGRLESFELADFNPVLVPLRAVSIRSGQMDKLTFDIRLNNDVSDGKTTFLYHDLKIDLLNTQDLKRDEFDNILKSVLVNTFFVQKSNPSGNSDPRIGIVHYNREKNKSMYDFWLKSILEGMKSTVSNTKDHN